MVTSDMYDILAEVADERARQEAKWGQQNHPWNSGMGVLPFAFLLSGAHGGWKDANQVKEWVDTAAQDGMLGYSEILFEEVAEALEAADIESVRAELVQVAAVAVAAIESIDRNGR